VGEIKVSATVVEHVKGPKVTSFKYRPKKRIRVKGGHRHFYTRLMIDFIGKAGEERKVAKKEAPAKVEKAEAKEESKVAKQAKAPAKDAEKKPAKKAEKAPATKKSTGTKSTSKSSTTKKTDKK
jgi:hypothetical protein